MRVRTLTTGLGLLLLAAGVFAAGVKVELEGLNEEQREAVRATLARDPWSETHLRVDTVDRWTIRLDGRA